MHKIVFILLFSPITAIFIFFMCNFLANAMGQFLNVNKPIKNAEVLIVDGWMHTGLLKYVKEEFNKDPYQYILVSGMGNRTASQANSQKKVDSDSLHVLQALIKLGIHTDKVKVVNCHATNMHRTFSMAFAAKQWFSKNDLDIKRVNILSAWSHGRKTWRAYQRVLKDNIKVGILTFPKRIVPFRKWLFRRGGFRYQLYSMVGFIYSAMWPIDLLTHPQQS